MVERTLAKSTGVSKRVVPCPCLQAAIEHKSHVKILLHSNAHQHTRPPKLSLIACCSLTMDTRSSSYFNQTVWNSNGDDNVR